MLTIPILEQLIPVFAAALWNQQPAYSLPSNAAVLTGLYQYVDTLYGPSLFEIYVQNNVLYAANTDGHNAYGVMNMTQVLKLLQPPTDIHLQIDNATFQVHNVQNSECRWVDDGSDLEIIYFTLNTDGRSVQSLTFMGITYQFQSKNCPNC